MAIGNLVGQFVSGQAKQMTGSQLHGNVNQLAQQAPNSMVLDAVKAALGHLGPQQVAQSVQQGTQQTGPTERRSLADMLLGAITQGGGSAQNVSSQLNLGSSPSPSALGELASLVAQHHPDALAQLLAGQLNTGNSGGLMSLLGHELVREIGVQIAKRL